MSRTAKFFKGAGFYLLMLAIALACMWVGPWPK